MNYLLKNPLVAGEIELKGRDKLKLGQQMKVTKKGHLFTLESINAGNQPAHLKDVERSEIHEFSAQSRSRLIREVSSYGALSPVFVTLTYGKDYPDPQTTKLHLKAFWRRIAKKHPDYWAVWKLEYQKRGAPHYHLLVYCIKGKPRIDKDFLKKSWWQATGIPNLRTEIKKLRSHRGGIWYATKYLAKTEVYQPVPTKASEGAGEGALSDPPGPGRFWGIMSRKNCPDNKTEFMLSPTQYKYLVSQALHGLAEFLVKQDIVKEYNIKMREVGELMTEDMITEKAKMLVRKSRVPVHLLSDEMGLISRLSSLADMADEYGVDFMDDYFSDL
jgi:hypothetical protein